jgi:hypothetical protein
MWLPPTDSSLSEIKHTYGLAQGQHMDVLQIFNSLFAPVTRLVSWLQNRANPVRKQAARILQVFEAHGIERTQINRLLPKDLQLLPFQFSDADELKKAFKQEHINWLIDYFALEPTWLEGTSDEANQQIFSYKSPELLHQWLQQHKNPSQDGCNFRLHLITTDEPLITSTSHGYFAAILEVLFGDEDERQSRFYHLGQGAHFEHPPCLLHLMQILAIAYHHNVIMRRAALPPFGLRLLSLNKGLIADWLSKTKPHPLEADHEFWGHFSGNTPWLTELRQNTEDSLIQAGLAEVVSTVQHDRKRFARAKQIG